MRDAPELAVSSITVDNLSEWMVELHGQLYSSYKAIRGLAQEVD